MRADVLSQIPDKECIARRRRQGGARAMDLWDLFIRMLEHINRKRDLGQGVSVKMEMKKKEIRKSNGAQFCERGFPLR